MIDLVEQLQAKEKATLDLYVQRRGVAIEILPLIVEEVHDADPFYDSNIYIDNSNQSKPKFDAIIENEKCLFVDGFSFQPIPMQWYTTQQEVQNNFNNVVGYISGDAVPQNSIIKILTTNIFLEIKDVKVARNKSNAYQYTFTLTDRAWA